MKGDRDGKSEKMSATRNSYSAVVNDHMYPCHCIIFDPKGS